MPAGNERGIPLRRDRALQHLQRGTCPAGQGRLPVLPQRDEQEQQHGRERI